MNSDTQQKSPLIADKKSVNVLALICVLVYFTSYVTRINYGAVVSEIVRAEGIGKEAVSLMNFLLPLNSNPYYMLAVWCAVSLLGTLICLCTAPFWRRKIHN